MSDILGIILKLQEDKFNAQSTLNTTVLGKTKQ